VEFSAPCIYHRLKIIYVNAADDPRKSANK